jgi:hypothetical protein
VLDRYFVVVLPLAVPFFVHICDDDRIAYLRSEQVPAPKYAFNNFGRFGPSPGADNLAVPFAAYQAA